MDDKTSFSNSNLEEVIYMSQPDGFVVPRQEDKISKLRKSLYRTKQTPRSGMKYLISH